MNEARAIPGLGLFLWCETGPGCQPWAAERM